MRVAHFSSLKDAYRDDIYSLDKRIDQRIRVIEKSGKDYAFATHRFHPIELPKPVEEDYYQLVRVANNINIPQEMI